MGVGLYSCYNPGVTSNANTYYPQANGVVEAFNKTLHKGLTKIYDIDKNDWDKKIIAILWAYRSTYK